MRNPFSDWDTEALATARTWFADIERTLACLLERCQAAPVEGVDARALLERLDDAVGDCRGAIQQLAEAQYEAHCATRDHDRDACRALRAAG